MDPKPLHRRKGEVALLQQNTENPTLHMPIEEEEEVVEEPHQQSMASTTTTTTTASKLSPQSPSPPAPPPFPSPSSSSPCTTNTTIATTTAFSSPPSASSSPSHDFTFTISLYPSPPYSSTAPKGGRTKGGSGSGGTNKKTSTAIDLSPADDIFFHGHLLPLHLLSRGTPPAISPRHSTADNLSTASLDSITAAAAADGENQKQLDRNSNNNRAAAAVGKAGGSSSATFKSPKSFSFLFGKWRREEEFAGGKKETTLEKKEPSSANIKKKKSFDVGRMLRRYATVVEALLFSGRSSADARDKKDLRRRPYSFSGTSNQRREGVVAGSGEEWRRRGKKRWGEFSAPASMRTSPTNSGLLVATGGNFGSSEESTMEELQNAIQAAIAHCKNSVALKEENNHINSSNTNTCK